MLSEYFGRTSDLSHIYAELNRKRTWSNYRPTAKRTETIHVTDVHIQAKLGVAQQKSLHTFYTPIMQNGGRNAHKTLTFR